MLVRICQAIFPPRIHTKGSEGPQPHLEQRQAEIQHLAPSNDENQKLCAPAEIIVFQSIISMLWGQLCIIKVNHNVLVEKILMITGTEAVVDFSGESP